MILIVPLYRTNENTMYDVGYYAKMYGEYWTQYGGLNADSGSEFQYIAEDNSDYRKFSNICDKKPKIIR